VLVVGADCGVSTITLNTPTDNLSDGVSYSLAVKYPASGGDLDTNYVIYFWWKVLNGTSVANWGTGPTVTVTYTSTPSVGLGFNRITGWTGTPTIEPNFNGYNYRITPAASPTLTGVTTILNNTALLARIQANGGRTSGGSGWGHLGAMGASPQSRAVATAGTNTDITGVVWSPATVTYNWIVMALYDLAVGAPPPAGALTLAGNVPGVTLGINTVITPYIARGRAPLDALVARRQWRREHRGGLLIPRWGAS
jgi:hypothetical protein